MFRSRRGMALITVLMVTFLLSLLTGALIGTHQANFALLSDSIYQRQSYLAASSGLDFAKYRLELNQGYGSGTLSNQVSTWGDLVVTESAFTNQVTGVFTNSIPPRQFVFTVVNNCTPSSVDPTTGAVVNATGTATIDVVGTCGNFQTHTRVSLVAAPLYDAACCSNGDMTLSSVGDWAINSKDPLRNWVRSNGSIKAPDALSNSTTQMHFSPQTCTSPGTLWAKGSVTIGTSDYTNTIAIDPTLSAQLFNNTYGMMAPHSSLNYNIYQLKIDDINKPNVAANITIPAGNYTVVDATIPYANTTYHSQWGGWDGNQFQGWQADPNPSSYNVTVAALQYIDESGNTKNYLWDQTHAVPAVTPDGTTQNANGWDHGQVAYNTTAVTMPVGNNQNVTTTNLVPLDSDGGAGFKFDFSSNLFTATNKAPLEVDGNLSIAGLTSANGSVPVLNVTFVDVNPAVSPAHPPGFMATNETINASISLEATVTGTAGLAATQDLTVAANSNMTVPTNAAQQGLVLWAGRNIEFDAKGGTNMGFLGVAYAHNNVMLNTTADNGGNLTNLVLDGALVAQGGSISMYKGQYVNTTYDPGYLNLFTKGLPFGTGRFVQVSFQIF